LRHKIIELILIYEILQTIEIGNQWEQIRFVSIIIKLGSMSRSKPFGDFCIQRKAGRDQAAHHPLSGLFFPGEIN
jgi:hypothetical protein